MDYSLYFLSVVVSFSLALLCIPAVVLVAKKKLLFESNDERKIHKQLVPPLGGVAIFIGFIVSTIIASGDGTFKEIKYVIAAVILLFFIGLKDDLIVVANRKKFIMQLIAALLLIVLGDIRLTNFHGFLGFYEVDYFIGALATLFLMILTINAYNLIDGIDGLASGLAIMGSSTFGLWFVICEEFQYAILSFALAGSLAGFFISNVFSKKNKVFMGDSGSLLIGLVMSALLVKFNQFDSDLQLPQFMREAPAISFAIVLVPLIDTLRVFSIRLKQGKSPFSPDTNHVHHRLLRIFGKHLKVTLTIIVVNGIFVFLALGLNHLRVNINLQFLIIIVLALVVSYIPEAIIKHREKHPEKNVYNL